MSDISNIFREAVVAAPTEEAYKIFESILLQRKLFTSGKHSQP